MTACALCLFAAACGGDDDDQPGDDGASQPDAGPVDEVDAAPDEPDASPGEVGFDSPYGGEIHIERIAAAPSLGFPALTHADAFFIRSQTPAISQMPEPGTCFTAADGLWPIAQAEEREYVDVGTVTVRGGPEDLELPATEDALDLLGRVHDLAYLHIMPDADTYISADTSYTVDIGGSDAYPAGSYGPIYVPTEVVGVSPPADTETAIIPASTEFTTTLEPATGAPEGVVVQNFVIIQPPLGGAALVCLDDESNDGEFTLTAEQVDAMPPTGNILRGHLTHQVVEFDDGQGNSGRRLDLIGVNCLATPYMVK